MYGDLHSSNDLEFQIEWALVLPLKFITGIVLSLNTRCVGLL